MTVRASYDGGRTWPVSKLIEEGASAYSCLARLSDGRIGLLYERGSGYRDLAFTSFTLDWLAQP
jgi:sialidase-1